MQLLFFVILMILSVPIHEFSHLLFLKMIGCKTKLQVRWWFTRGANGSAYIKPADGGNELKFDLPSILRDYYRTIPLFTGLSGGWGVAILMSPGLLLLYQFPELKSLLGHPLILVILFNLGYGIFESIKMHRETNTNPEG